MTTRGGSADNANTNYSAFAPQTSWRNTADNITSLVVVATTEIGVGSHFELWTPRAIHVVSNP